MWSGLKAAQGRGKYLSERQDSKMEDEKTSRRMQRQPAEARRLREVAAAGGLN